MTAPAPTTKGAATRADILRVASEVFGARGYAQTRMDDVVAATGLTKGAIYFHFDSKAQLARAVVEDHKERWMARVADELAATPEPRDQVLALVPFLTRLVVDDPTAWSVGRLTGELRVELGEDAPDLLADWVELVADVLDRGRDTGQLAFDDEPRDLAALFVGAFDGLKSLTDSVDGADVATFTRRAAMLGRLVETSVLPG